MDNIKITKERCLQLAAMEGDQTVGAGATEELMARRSAADCSQCCGAEMVIHRLLAGEWEIAGSAVYANDERERIEAITEREPDIEPPSIYCESCAKCGAVVRGWVEPDPVFNPANDY